MVVSSLLHLSKNSTSWLWNWRIPCVLKLLFSQVAAVVQEYDRLLAFWLRDSDTRVEILKIQWTGAEPRLKTRAWKRMAQGIAWRPNLVRMQRNSEMQLGTWKRPGVVWLIALLSNSHAQSNMSCGNDKLCSLSCSWWTSLIALLKWFFWFQTLISSEVQVFQRAKISKFSQYLHIFTFLKLKSDTSSLNDTGNWSCAPWTCSGSSRCGGVGALDVDVDLHSMNSRCAAFRYWISWLLSCASQLSTAEAKVGFRKKTWKDPTNLQDFLSIEAYPAMWISTNFQAVVSAFWQELLWKSRDQEALAPFLTWRAWRVLDCKTSVIVTGCCKMLQDLSFVESTQSINLSVSSLEWGSLCDATVRCRSVAC